MSTGADQGWNPYTGEAVGPPVPHATDEDVDRLARAAAGAAPALAALPVSKRIDLLLAAAAALEANREELVALADSETGLGPVRLNRELTRTRVQLEMFAGLRRDAAV